MAFENPIRKETQAYVKNVMALYLGLKPPPPPVPVATPQSRYPNSRVRPAILGGALNRGNLPSASPVAMPPLGAKPETN